MKRMLNAAKTIGLAATLALGARNAHAQETPRFETGYNAAEIGLATGENTRQRTVTNIGIELKPGVYLHWGGMNQLENFDRNTYFGRNVFTLGRSTRLALVNKRIGSGSIDTKVGLSNNTLPGKAGLYGTIDATVDDEAGNITAFLGKPLPNGMSMELYHDHELPFQGRPGTHTELQLNKALGKSINAYLRAESDNFRKPIYVVGAAVHK